MSESTEAVRRQLVAEINSKATSRAALEAKYGQVWDTGELQEEFSVLGFLAPFCVVRRRSDGVTGSVTFQNDPRYYYNFQPDQR